MVVTHPLFQGIALNRRIDTGPRRACIGLALAFHAMSLLTWFDLLSNTTTIAELRKEGRPVLGLVLAYPALPESTGGMGLSSGTPLLYQIAIGETRTPLPAGCLRDIASGSSIELLQSGKDPACVLVGRSDSGFRHLYEKNFGNLVLSLIRATGTFLLGGWCIAAALRPRDQERG